MPVSWVQKMTKSLSGSYEKKGDSYVLNGFGELTITPINKSSYSLQLTNKGKVSKLTAEKAGVLPSDKNTDYLCRTWEILSVTPHSEL